MQTNRNMKNSESIVYSVKEAAEVLGISSSLLYSELRKNPDFPRKKIGGRIMIPVKRLQAYFDS